MDSTALLTSMSEPVYQKLLQAVETGKWLDGSPLSGDVLSSQSIKV